MANTNNPQPGGRNQSDAKEKLSEEAERAKHKVAEAGDKLGQEARKAGEAIKREGAEVLDSVKDSAAKVAEQQQSNIAGQLGGVANALREAAGQLGDDQAWLADGVRQTAGGVDRLSASVRDKDLKTLTRDVTEYARQQPALAIGGAMLLGFALARFATSTSQDSYDDDRSPQRYS